MQYAFVIKSFYDESVQQVKKARRFEIKCKFTDCDKITSLQLRKPLDKDVCVGTFESVGAQ